MKRVVTDQYGVFDLSRHDNLGKSEISVVMSVYNGGEYLRAAIDSILDQTFKKFEFVIINDGSNQEDTAYLNECYEKDKRVVLIEQENIGLTRSLNRGIQISSGDYIARQDADDISELHRLEHCLNNISDDDIQVSLWKEIRNDELIPSSFLKVLKWVPVLLTQRFVDFGNLFVHGTFFFKKSIYEKVGGYRIPFKYAQDYDFLLRAKREGNLSILKEELYQLRLHDSNLSSKNYFEQSKFSALASLLLKREKKQSFDENELASLFDSKTGFLKLKNQFPFRSCMILFFNSLKSRRSEWIRIFLK